MARKYIKVFFDWDEATSELTPEEKGRLIDALIAYAQGKPYSVEGNERFVFPGLRLQIDRDAAAYEEISEKRKQAGAKGGKQRAANQAFASNCKQDKDQDKDQDQDEDKDEDKDKDDSVVTLPRFFSEKSLDETYICPDALSPLERGFLESCTRRTVESARERLALPNNNWLHSERARFGTAQHVVDAIVRDARWGKNPAETDGLYDTILGVLEDRNLSPLTIYIMATKSAVRSNFYQRMSGVIR